MANTSRAALQQNQGEKQGAQKQWLRCKWCVWLAVWLVVLGAVLNTIYLFNHCPVGFSDDEAHYWEWSRHLDYGYYSKPPGIAWLLWAAQRAGESLGLTGDGSGIALMPVLRLPAVILGMFSGVLSLLLARRIFRDDRTSLMVIVLCAAVPMFAIGSLLITIDSPTYLCWAAAVYCLWRYLESDSPGWLYAAGLCAGIGMLFKPILIALPLCAALGAWMDRGGSMRRRLISRHSFGAMMIMLSSQIPVLIWNANHGWVTLRHVLTQGGMGAQATSVAKPPWQRLILGPLSRVGEFVGGQAGGMAGLMFFLLVIAVVIAWRRTRVPDDAAVPVSQRTRWIFLLSFSVPIWGFYFFLGVFTKTEVNWPAMSYFSGMVLLGGVLTEGWNSPVAATRRAWRSWGTAAILVGVLLTATAMNTHRFYPWISQKLAPLEGTAAYEKSFFYPRKWDQPMVRLRGLPERASIIERERLRLRDDARAEPLLITDRYYNSSSLSFYMPGHPFVFCIMSNVGLRHSQYDLWPGLDETAADGKLVYAGRPAIIMGDFDPEVMDQVIRKAFDRVEAAEHFPIRVDGVTIHDITIYRAWGFRGMPGLDDRGFY